MITLRLSTRAVTLVEVMVCFVILMIVGLGVVGSVVFTRQSMEVDKQRIAALNYCRQAIEAAAAHATISSGQQVLIPFNTPGSEDLYSTLDLAYYDIVTTPPNTGKIDWSNKLTVAPENKPVYCQVKVTWYPAGTWGTRQQKVSMGTIVRAGML